MERSRTLFRRVATLCLLLYIGGMVVPLLHAGEAGARHTEAHFHGPKADCAPAHDEYHCPTCQFAYGAAADTATPPHWLSASARRSSAAADPHAALGRSPDSLPDARAPPRRA
jgi:hypothetical protein